MASKDAITITAETDGIITLSKPIEINGKTYRDLSYDMDEITMELQARAEGEAKKLSSKSGGFSMVQETDYTYQTFLGMAAVIAVNPNFDWMDLKRIKGRDLKKLNNIGRLYFFGSEEPDEDSSENAPELTPSGSTQA